MLLLWAVVGPQVTDLQRQRNELAQRVEELTSEQANALQPMIDALQSEVATLRTDMEEERVRAETADRELKASRERLTQVRTLQAVLIACIPSKRAQQEQLPNSGCSWVSQNCR